MTKIYQTAIFLLLFAVTFVTGCRHASYSPELEAIDRLIAENPDSALSELSRISPDSLSEADRNLYNLLTIKAGDKNYVRHSSDSLILTVIDYYDRHDADPRHAEALYYGGRVYSDIGDYPSALRYFQAALEKLPEDTENLRLKSKILSQLAWIFNSMRIYDKAITNLEKCIDIDRKLKDSVNLLNDMEILGAVYIHQNKLQNAENIFRETSVLAEKVNPGMKHRQKMYLAGIYERSDRNGPALSYIRGVPDSIRDSYHGTALGYAIDIYLKHGIADTAYMYAVELVHHNSSRNRKKGYQSLISPELRRFVPVDSLYSYTGRYADIMEGFVSSNSDELALIQQAAFNYEIQEKAKFDAQNSKKNAFIWILVLMVVILLLTIIIAFVDNRRKKNLISLHKALKRIKSLNTELANCRHAELDEDKSIEHENNDASSEGNEMTTKKDGGISETSGIVEQKEHLELKDQILAEFNEITERNHNKLLPKALSDSDSMQYLIQNLRNGKAIPIDSTIWDNLEKDISETYPDFNRRLSTFLGDKPRKDDTVLAMLIKCGFSPSETSTLLAKSRSTISYRRKCLSLKFFGQDMDQSGLDNFIQLL